MRRLALGLVALLVVGALVFVLVRSNLLRGVGMVEFSPGERGLNRMAISGPYGWSCIEYSKTLGFNGTMEITGSGMADCTLFGGTNGYSNSYPDRGSVEVPLEQDTLVYQSQDKSYEIYVLITRDEGAYKRFNPSFGTDPEPKQAATVIAGSSDAVVIDFATCGAIRQQIAVAFGSTTYEISGAQDGICHLKYGGEVENPNWDGRLDTVCLVPQTQGILRFPSTTSGVDFGAIGSFCTKE